MKVGKLINTNKKGQIVIPQEYRKMFGITEEIILNITPKSTGLFIQPIEKVVPKSDSSDMYIEVLRRTKGSWGKDSSPISKEKRKFELEASRRRKQGW